MRGCGVLAAIFLATYRVFFFFRGALLRTWRQVVPVLRRGRCQVYVLLFWSFSHESFWSPPSGPKIFRSSSGITRCAKMLGLSAPYILAKFKGSTLERAKIKVFSQHLILYTSSIIQQHIWTHVVTYITDIRNIYGTHVRHIWNTRETYVKREKIRYYFLKTFLKTFSKFKKQKGKHMSIMCLTCVRYMVDICLTYVQYMFNICSTYVWHMFDTCFDICSVNVLDLILENKILFHTNKILFCYIRLNLHIIT